MKKTALVLLSSFLITLSVYPFNFWWLSFVYLIPLFAAITVTDSLKERLYLSILWGISVFALNFFWTIKTIEIYGKIPIWLSYILGIPLSIYQTLPFIVFALAFKPLYKKNILLPALLFPILTNFMPLIFPYSISSTLSSSPLFIQTASIWGEWGLDFVLITVNILLFNFLSEKNKKQLISAISILAAMFAFGFLKISIKRENFPVLKITVIQPCVYDGDGIETQKEKFFTSIAKIRNIAENSVIIIPESSLPDDIQMSPLREEIMEKVRERLNAKGILYNSVRNQNGKIFNSEILLTENGIEIYNKNKLMLFGEYFPFYSLIQKLPLYISNFANFERGKNANPLSFKNIKIATPICLEAVFQNYTAKLSENALFIVNPSDDEWFLSDKAKMLHFAQSRIKTVENGKYLVRATNNGFTVIVDNYGKIIKKLPINKQSFLTASIPLIDKKTIFSKTAKAFPVAFPFIFLILFLLTGKRKNG